jgi:hypothetical protein
MVFCFVQKFFFGQHKILTLGYMTKTLNQIFFFLHQNQNIFFSNIGNQNIFFLEKNHNPPPQVKWSFPNDCHSIVCSMMILSVAIWSTQERSCLKPACSSHFLVNFILHSLQDYTTEKFTRNGQ